MLMEKVEGKGILLRSGESQEQGATDWTMTGHRPLQLPGRNHKVKNDCPPLYLRKIRETVGDGECIFGILDD